MSEEPRKPSLASLDFYAQLQSRALEDLDLDVREIRKTVGDTHGDVEALRRELSAFRTENAENNRLTAWAWAHKHPSKTFAIVVVLLLAFAGKDQVLSVFLSHIPTFPGAAHGGQ